MLLLLFFFVSLPIFLIRITSIQGTITISVPVRLFRICVFYFFSSYLKKKQESGIGIPVTLKIDKYGFYLYWLDASNEVDYIDIATIRDVRTGRYAKTPKVCLWYEN